MKKDIVEVAKIRGDEQKRLGLLVPERLSADVVENNIKTSASPIKRAVASAKMRHHGQTWTYKRSGSPMADLGQLTRSMSKKCMESIARVSTKKYLVHGRVLYG